MRKLFALIERKHESGEGVFHALLPQNEVPAETVCGYKIPSLYKEKNALSVGEEDGLLEKTADVDLQSLFRDNSLPTFWMGFT
jgi:hypothetical protein